jgi:hypothetical protein
MAVTISFLFIGVLLVTLTTAPIAAAGIVVTEQSLAQLLTTMQQLFSKKPQKDLFVLFLQHT